MDHQPPTSPVKTFELPDGMVEHHVVNVESWDDFELLAHFLEKEFFAELVEKLDGICSRIRKYDIGGVEIVLKHHDDIGNFFYSRSDNPQAKVVLRKITDAFNERLAGFFRSKD